MTLDLERAAIETFFAARWGVTTPWIPDGQPGEPVVDSARLTIQSGRRLQGSIGKLQNRIDNVGILTITLYTDGEQGSTAWRVLAQQAIDIFHGVTLNQAGAVITATADAFVRFSPPQQGGNQHPYIGASFKNAPFHITNVIAPFIRYSLK